MARFLHLRPMLWTEKMQESIDFYTEILGFRLDEYNEEWNWASLSKDQTSFMLAKPNEHESYSRISFSGSFYFNVDDLDSLYESLKERCRICYEPGEYEWQMKEFAVYDVNGYILQFGQNME